jgi:hypothetical protein
VQELAKKNDSAEVVGVVGSEGDELVAHGHDANGDVGTRWASDGMVKACVVLCRRCCMRGFVEKAVAETVPGFGAGRRREAARRFFGIGSFSTVDPVESEALPEGEVPELAVDGVWRAGDLAMGEVFGKAFEDVCGGGGVAFGDQCLGKFVHDASVCAVIIIVANAEGVCGDWCAERFGRIGRSADARVVAGRIGG